MKFVLQSMCFNRNYQHHFGVVRLNMHFIFFLEIKLVFEKYIVNEKQLN